MYVNHVSKWVAAPYRIPAVTNDIGQVKNCNNKKTVSIINVNSICKPYLCKTPMLEYRSNIVKSLIVGA